MHPDAQHSRKQRENERVQPGGDEIPEHSPGGEQTRRETIHLWAGILAGPFFWFAQQQLCFVLVPWACAHGGAVWLHGITAVCLVATLLAGWVAGAYGRREAARVEPTAGQQRVRFMAVLGVLSSVFFALTIVAQGVPNFILDPCQR